MIEKDAVNADLTHQVSEFRRRISGIFDPKTIKLFCVIAFVPVNFKNLFERNLGCSLTAFSCPECSQSAIVLFLLRSMAASILASFNSLCFCFSYLRICYSLTSSRLFASINLTVLFILC